MGIMRLSQIPLLIRLQKIVDWTMTQQTSRLCWPGCVRLNKKSAAILPLQRKRPTVRYLGKSYRRPDMNCFEQELRRVVGACGGIMNPIFTGRACYADLGGDNRGKIQFVTQGTHEKYEALEVKILNRSEGEVDAVLFRFADIWGKKQVSNPNFQDGIIPHIATYNEKSEWYVYRPTDADIKQLTAGVGAYLDLFTDHSLIPEKAQGKVGEKESVIKAIRDSKLKPAPRKDASVHKKSEQEL